jgi:hypothetical protein
VVFLNSNSITFGMSSNTVTASFSQSTHAHSFINQINGSSGSISFNTGSSLSSSANASGITFGLASNITTALQSIGAYLTTAAQVSHTHGNVSLSLTNLSGTYSSASNGLTISLTAVNSTNFIQTSESGNLYFSNGSGVSWGSSVSCLSTTLTASIATTYAGTGFTSTSTSGSVLGATLNTSGLSMAIPVWLTAGGTGGGAALKGSGTYTQNSGTIEFANSNSVTFGLTAGSMTASVGRGNVYFTGGSNITWDSSVDGVSTSIMATAGGGTGTGGGLSGSNTSQSLGTITFGSSNNMHFYFTNSSLVGSFSESTHAHSFVNQINGSSGSISFNTASSLSSSANASGITFGLASNISTAWSGQTTANQSRVIDFNGSSGQISFVTGSGMSTTTNASTLTFGLRSDISTAWSGQTTANQSRVIAFNGSTGNISLVTGSGMSTTTNASTLTFGLRSDISTAWSGQTTANASRVIQLNATSGSLTLSASSNITISNDASTIKFSVADAIPLGSSTRSAGINTSVSAAYAGSTLAFSANSSGITMSVPAWITTAYSTTSQFSASFLNTGEAHIRRIQVSDSSYSSGTIELSGSRNVTVTYNASTVSIYGPANILNSFSVGGNTGTTGSSNITGGGFVLAGGSNITLSQSNNTISFHGGAGAAGVAVGDSQTTYTSGTVLFSGEANITIHTSVNAGSQYIRISGGAGAGESNYIYLYGNTSNLSSTSGGTISLSAGTNITLAQSGGSIKIEGPSGNVYFQDASGISWSTSVNGGSSSISGIFNATGSTITTTSGTDAKMTLNTAGLNLALPIFVTNAYSASSQLTATFAQVNHTHGNVSIGQTNISVSGTTAGSGLSLDFSVAAPGGGAAISAAGSSQNAGTIVFSNSNSVSFGMNVSTITASVGRGSVYYNDASGISWSSSVDSLSTSLYAAFNATGTSSTSTGGSTLGFSLGTGGLTMSVPAWRTDAGGGGAALQGSGTYSQNTGTISFAASNGITFGLSTNQMTAQHDGARYYYLVGANTAGTTSGTFSQNALRLSGYNMITLNGINDSIIEISLNSGSLLGTAASSQFVKGWSISGNTSGTSTQNISQSLYFVGGNNITLSGNGSSIVMSAPNAISKYSLYGNTLGVSSGTFSDNVIHLSGMGDLTINGQGGGTIGLSATAGGGGAAISAGTQSVSTGTGVFSNSNGLTFGMSGSSRMTASYNSTQYIKGWSLGTSTGGSTAGTTTQNISESLYLVAGSNMNLSGSGSSIVINAIPQGSVYFADIVGFSWTSTTAANATTFALKTA